VIGEHTEEEASLASLYVLGLLPPDDARKFRDAIAADPALAALVAHLETGAAALAWTAPPRVPTAALRARIMDSIKPVEAAPANVVPFPNRWAWLPWAAAACFAVMAANFAYKSYHAVLLVDSFVIRDRAQQMELDRVQTQEAVLQNHLADAESFIASDATQKAALQSQIDSMRGQLADLKARNALSEIKIATLASMAKNAPQAMAVVAWDGAAQRGILKTLHMPAAQPDQDYQLWIIDPDYKQPVSAGVFDPGKGSSFQPLHPISKADKFAVSLEKKGGSPAPQGPIVLVGE
jgi:anti-sigma-K factor RskA